MNTTPAAKNYEYYFKKARNPIIWLWGAELKDAEIAAKAIYLGSTEWLTSDSKIIDALLDREGGDMPGNKPMGVDIMLINTDAAPIRLLIPHLEKSKVYLVRTDVPDDIKQIFRAKELVLAEEIDCGKGVFEQTWVRSGRRRP